VTDSELDALFACDPGAFVRERDRLASELTRAGRRDEAKRIKALPRPTLSVWATNQAVRRAPEALRALLVASEELRQALASGADSATPATQTRYGRGLAAQREAVSALVEEARRALTEAGRNAEHAALARIENNLRRAAADPAARTQLRAGRLTSDVSVAELEALLGELPLPTRSPSEPARAASAPGRAPVRDRAADERERKRAEEAEARRRAQRLADAERAVTAARRERDRAQAEADERRREVRALGEQLERATRRSADATRAIEAAQEKLAAAERALKGAQQTR
jgi:colicin import membrane protein